MISHIIVLLSVPLGSARLHADRLTCCVMLPAPSPEQFDDQHAHMCRCRMMPSAACWSSSRRSVATSLPASWRACLPTSRPRPTPCAPSRPSAPPVAIPLPAAAVPATSTSLCRCCPPLALPTAEKRLLQLLLMLINQLTCSLLSWTVSWGAGGCLNLRAAALLDCRGTELIRADPVLPAVLNCGPGASRLLQLACPQQTLSPALLLDAIIC